MATSYPEGWEEVDGALQRAFEHETFPAAIAFVNRIADLAEEVGHHPDFVIHFRMVTLRLWTHTAGAITDNDTKLAARINELVG